MCFRRDEISQEEWVHRTKEWESLIDPETANRVRKFDFLESPVVQIRHYPHTREEKQKAQQITQNIVRGRRNALFRRRNARYPVWREYVPDIA
ncbi:hypothetical protein HYFRA_00010801 [Hymenoscyphus fraxineus]|uniref:Uncharacterized protein n=1 Tax=Hymenoscyphus fraxineus TaxID=746836 RepID=A0A9N9L443_9HELO|nr:hypothetical protein HYFRA_00010801 [Hymenoscyphus fraxineus]